MFHGSSCDDEYPCDSHLKRRNALDLLEIQLFPRAFLRVEPEVRVSHQSERDERMKDRKEHAVHEMRLHPAILLSLKRVVLRPQLHDRFLHVTSERAVYYIHRHNDLAEEDVRDNLQRRHETRVHLVRIQHVEVVHEHYQHDQLCIRHD